MRCGHAHGIMQTERIESVAGLNHPLTNESQPCKPSRLSRRHVVAFTIGLFLIGLLAIIMAPESTAHMSRLGRGRPISSLALGLVTMVCVPIAIVPLLVMGVGAMALNARGAAVPVRIRKEKRVVPVGETGPGSRQEPTFRVD
jgi:hypothetical protein